VLRHRAARRPLRGATANPGIRFRRQPISHPSGRCRVSRSPGRSMSGSDEVSADDVDVDGLVGHRRDEGVARYTGVGA
jgi:hypothetical protein